MTDHPLTVDPITYRATVKKNSEERKKQSDMVAMKQYAICISKINQSMTDGQSWAKCDLLRPDLRDKIKEELRLKGYDSAGSTRGVYSWV